MSSTPTIPMTLSASRRLAKSPQQLRWQRWRTYWGLPLAIAALPGLLLLLSVQLGMLAAAWLHSQALHLPNALMVLLQAEPPHALAVAIWAGLSFVLTFLAIRIGLTDTEHDVWRILTEQELSELEQLALVVPAVDEMVDEIYRLGRTPVLQDLLQARVVGGSRTLAVAWLKRRLPPSAKNRKVRRVVSDGFTLPVTMYTRPSPLTAAGDR